MDQSLLKAQAVLAAQRFSVMLGAELVAFSIDGVEICLTIRPEFQQQFGFVHGGVLAYLADNALTFAGGAALGEAVVTSEFKINYIRPARGEQLIARANILHAGRTQAVSRCDVVMVQSGIEQLCASAQGTIALLGSALAR